MRTNHANEQLAYLQLELYNNLNNFSRRHGVLGRFCAIPVSLVDVALDYIKEPLSAIENVALAALNLFGCIFFQNCKLKDALTCTELAMRAVVHIPIKSFLAPFKVVYQIFAILINPAKVMTISSTTATFRP